MRAGEVLPAGAWDAGRETDRVLVDHDRRHRRRILLLTQGGREVLLDDGGVVRVSAKPELLAEIHAHDDAELVRIAWHLGNRHLPVQLLGTRIRIRVDHVIEAMVAGLGGHVEHVEAPFDPEAGAYAGGHSHGHDDEDHGHAHGDEHDG